MCDKKFALGSDLKEHERTHTDEESFTCLQCDKKFKHFGDMKQHKKLMLVKNLSVAHSVTRDSQLLEIWLE